MAEAPADSMTINFKTTKGAKESITISKTATVKELKDKIQEKATDLEAERQRVIYKGRVLKDEQTVEACGLSDGQMVIVVAKKANKPKAATTAASNPAPTTSTSAPTNPSTTTTNTAPNASATGSDAQANPFAAFMNPGMGGMGNGMGGMGGLGGMGAMGMNPQMMQNMLQNPMVQQMMQQMAQNPQMLQQMMQNNPMLQQMMQNNPQAAAMMQNPQMLQAMFNPQMIQAALQMNQAMASMRQAQQQMGQQQQGSTASTGTGSTGTSATGTGTGTNANAQADPNANPFAAMFGAPPNANGAQANPFAMFGQNPMFGMPQQGFGQPQQPAQDPQVLYANQLNTLNNMGFTDAEANLNALKATGGNVQAAIDRLLGGN